MYLHVYKINLVKNRKDKVKLQEYLVFFQPFCCDSTLIGNDIKYLHSLMESFPDHRQKSAADIYLLSFIVNYNRK